MEALRRYVRFTHLLLWSSGDAIFKLPKKVQTFRFNLFRHFCFFNSFVNLSEKKILVFVVYSKNDKKFLLFSLELSTVKVQGYGSGPYFWRGVIERYCQLVTAGNMPPQQAWTRSTRDFENEKCSFKLENMPEVINFTCASMYPRFFQDVV